MEYEFFDARLIQADRLLRIVTPLGEDVALPEKVTVTEAINGLFEITVDLKSKRTDIAPEEIVGMIVDVSLEIAYGTRRLWNGLVTGLMEGPPVSRGLRSYRLTIRPHLWLLSQRSDHRIWNDQSSLQVVETLLSEHGIRAAVMGGVITPPKPEHYSVQYGETDFAYLTRRLEADGLFYWFEHESGEDGAAGSHVLHIAGHQSGYTRGPEPDVRLSAGSTDRNHITKFERHYQFTPGKRATGDWNFEMPKGPQGGLTPSLVSLPKNAEYELFDYPAKALDGEANERASRLRMQAVEVDHQTISGGSSIRTLAAGRRFKPYELAHAEPEFEEYVVTAITHTIVDHSYETVEDGSLDYVNSFTALPSKLPATPHRATARPRIDGSQVAIVAGPPGEEIHPDKYGRIKVWFPWQRNRARKDGSDTCWIRVMQSWAGGGWGAQVIPRIGMEVMVTYLEGDPDRPVVTGIVPNPSTKVPYDLPANKTKSVFKSNTHKGIGFNELTFEDEKGREEVYLHAQKDLTIKVQNHKTERVDANQVVSVGGASVTEVHRSDIHNIGQSMTLNVGTGPAGDIARGKLIHDVFGIRSSAYFVTDMLPLMTGMGNYTVNASSAIMLNALGASFHTTSGASFTSVGLDQTQNIGGSIRIAAGNDFDEVVTNKKLIEAHGEIQFRCGKSEIVMKPDGTIHIKGTNLIIEEDEKTKITAAKIELN